MTATVSIRTKGATLTRMILAQCRTRGAVQAADYARRTWGEHSPVAKITRAAIAGGTTLAGSGYDVLTDYQAAKAEYVELVRPATIIGRLTGLRIVPLATRVIAETGAASAYWVGQGRAKPISKLALEGTTLTPLKVAGIVALTDELVRSADPAAEPLVRSDLVGAIGELIDTSFVDPENGGVADVSPPSITHGLTPISSTGNPAEDLRLLLADFDHVERGYLLLNPKTATEMALARDSAGAFLFPDLGARGGFVVGVPVITSSGVPWTTAGGTCSSMHRVSFTAMATWSWSAPNKPLSR
jgi:HK97 family phage major capsid protein